MRILVMLDNLDFMKAIWLFPIAFTLHEAEEWNILAWYQRNYGFAVQDEHLLRVPIIGYLAIGAVRENYAPIWYVIGLAILLIVPGLVQTVRAGNRLTPQFRAIHNFSIALSKRLGRM